MAKVDNPNLRYTNDVTHCDAINCGLYEKCYRGWLNEELHRISVNHEDIYPAAYFLRKKYRKCGCKHFIDINGL